MSDSNQIQIYYEISMSIGSSLDINQMLKQSLSTYMRKLNCSSGVILQRQDDSDQIRLERILSLPFITSKNESCKIYIDVLPKSFTAESYNELTASLPVTEKLEDGRYYYIMDLPGFGIFIITSKTAIAATIIESLKPLNQKLASAAKACLWSDALKKSEEELVNLNIHLENRVKDRTSLLEDALMELKENISEREKAFLSLNESEGRMKAILDYSPAVIYLKDIEGNYILINKLYEKLFHITNEKIEGKSDFDIFPREVAEIFRKSDQMVLTAGKALEIEEDVPHKDGMHHYISLKFPLYDTRGKVYSICGISTDITKRKMADELLRESEARLRIITNSANDCIIMMDDEGEICFWNTAAEEIFGYSVSEAIGKHLHDLLVPERFQKSHHDAFPKWTKTGEGDAIGKILELSGIRKGGAEFPLDLSISSVKHDNRWMAIGIIRDITERKNLETQLLQAQKLESIGQLAAGIAHEINTPLQFVGDNTAFMKDASGAILEYFKLIDQAIADEKDNGDISRLIAAIQEKAKKLDIEYLSEEIPIALEQSQDGIKHVSKIVLAMKDFSHPGKKDKSFADINRGIEVTATISKSEWKYSSDMEIKLEPTLPLVYCVLDEINQVILNMIVNAAHAIEELVGNEPLNKGKITIETKKADDYIEIIISDTGKGIKEENLNNLFDPFFTTKEVGKGTGQGLSIAHDIIVNKHGGNIFVDSAWGKGTTFTVKIPISFNI